MARVGRRSYLFGVDAAAFTERVGELEKVLEKTLRERDEYRKLYELLSEEVERLRRGLLGSKAERVDAAQTQLAFDAVRDLILAAVLRAEQGNDPAAGSECVATEETPTTSGSQPSAQPSGAPGKGTTSADKSKGGHGRSRNPEHLPVERIEIVPPEVLANPELFEKIGEDASETLERRSAMTVRVVTVRSKYVLRSSRSSRPVADVDAPCAPHDAQAVQCDGQQSSCEDGCCPTFPEALEDLGSTCHAETTASTDPRGATTAVVEGAGTNAAAIFISALPARAIARCRAGPSLLAHVLRRPHPVEPDGEDLRSRESRARALDAL